MTNEWGARVVDPSRTQRLGAYAVAVHEDRLLLTRISPIGYPAGAWTLPGGGVDHGESPHDTVRRELYEEAGLEAMSTRLVDVHHVHIVDVGRGDQYEDYHGVHLLYAVEVDPSIEPHEAATAPRDRPAGGHRGRRGDDPRRVDRTMVIAVTRSFVALGRGSAAARLSTFGRSW